MVEMTVTRAPDIEDTSVLIVRILLATLDTSGYTTHFWTRTEHILSLHRHLDTQETSVNTGHLWALDILLRMYKTPLDNWNAFGHIGQ